MTPPATLLFRPRTRRTVTRMTTAHADANLPWWQAQNSPETRAAVAKSIAESPPLTDRQRERLRLLLRPKATTQ